MIDNNVLLKLWKDRQTVDGLDPNHFRLDPCGALIEWSKFGDPKDENGWVIDHVVPRASLVNVPEDVIDDPINLRPMHVKNNAAKGTSYPLYNTRVVYEGGKNVDCEGVYEISIDLQKTLNEFFSKYGI